MYPRHYGDSGFYCISLRNSKLDFFFSLDSSPNIIQFLALAENALSLLHTFVVQGSAIELGKNLRILGSLLWLSWALSFGFSSHDFYELWLLCAVAWLWSAFRLNYKKWKTHPIVVPSSKFSPFYQIYFCSCFRAFR